MINRERLIKSIEDISKFGALEGGGITRLAFSKEEKAARKHLLELAGKLGLSHKEDGFGNIFLTLKGEDSTLPSIATGSHLDSVPNGGCYDGALGVMCGLEAIASIKESGKKPLRDLTLIVFSAEESSRFKMATMGSKLIAGKLDEKRLKELKDEDDISAYEAAKEFGCDVLKLDRIKLANNTFGAYIELHIEQGPVLERLCIPVGLVNGIAAPVRFELTIEGRADHSGATPMNMRKDALLMASRIIIALENIAKQRKNTVATVGYVKAKPGVLNVIAGSVTMGVDIRDISKEELESVDKEAREMIDELCKKEGFGYSIRELVKDTPVKLSDNIIELAKNEAKKLDIKTHKMPSGAGHDAMNMVGIAKDVGMLFIPCKNGISHNTKEQINYDDAATASNLLAHMLLSLASR
ncbi:M20 family metallo-hydrolase [uncultured Campylobacter sp.]|uniref:M20 family metallo-hydrolase n=1 Tax=uncultured Campylobacter sp. TaxID=218934 RepID=UPI00260E26F7|nr:M20 family metallo-hydrolase [uncultured Campylobacter sp.]